jgi:hypothetical protein
MKLFFLFFVLAVPCVYSQNGCAATLSWTSPICQVAGSGTINPMWTIVSRHGEYDQSETECNIPSQISVGGPNGLVVTTAFTAGGYTCNDFNPVDNSRCSPNGGAGFPPCPLSYSYITGDIQWNTFNFKFGTVVWKTTYPPSNAQTWPSHWFLGANCQDSNKYSGDTGMDGCPNFGATGYDEIDGIECIGTGDCGFHLYHSASQQGCDIGGSSSSTFVPAGAVWAMNWTASNVSLFRNGTQVCNFTTNIPSQNMFMLIQNQTGGVAGTPVNGNLPVTLTTNYVKVCNTSYTVAQCTSAVPTAPCVGTCSDANVMLFDDFSNVAASFPPPAFINGNVRFQGQGVVR